MSTTARQPTLAQKLSAEFFGTAFLLATVIGSGIMGDRLSDGNIAIALLGNTIPTGAILVVLITAYGPVSGAHFNPVVSLVFALKNQLKAHETVFYIAAQIIGGILGVLAAHIMFEEQVFQLSQKIRSGGAQFFSEIVATFGLVLTILATLRARPDAVAMSVGLYITAAYWFTASTSFANPAVTIARSLSDTFAGIRMTDAPLFIAAQLVGGGLALAYFTWQFRSK